MKRVEFNTSVKNRTLDQRLTYIDLYDVSNRTHRGCRQAAHNEPLLNDESYPKNPGV